jgi:hypothetical protein
VTEGVDHEMEDLHAVCILAETAQSVDGLDLDRLAFALELLGWGRQRPAFAALRLNRAKPRAPRDESVG